MNRDELIALAEESGWTVIGNNWLRFRKGDTRIEVWYAGEKPRMVSAALHSASTGTRRCNIVHDRAAALSDTVRSWLAPPLAVVDRLTLPALRTNRARRNGPVVGNAVLFA